MYRLDITYTGAYGDTDPDTGDPCIVVTPDPDHVGTYIYSWITYTAELGDDEINGTIVENWNSINTFTFKIYYGSDNWDVFFPARTKLRLWSEKEQDFIFQGRVANVTDSMDSDGKLYRTIECESELAYLCDSICDTADVKQTVSDLNRSLNTRDVLVTILEKHHLRSGGIAGVLNKSFFPPNADYDDNTDTFYNFQNSYPTVSMANALSGDVNTTYSVIQDLFINTLGMDIWVSYDDGAVPEGGDATWTFGYLVLNMAVAGNGHTSPTGLGDDIVLSTNMRSLKVESTPTSNGRITRIVPLGGIGQNGQRLNVWNIDQYPIGWQVATHDLAVANQLLAITYGDIDKVSLHEDLVDDGNKSEAEVNAMIQELYRRGKAEADALSGGITSITVEAVDLYEAGYNNTHKFTVGDFHRITNDFFGLDETFRLVKKTTDLAEPWNAKLEFAKTQTRSTSITANRTANTASRIYNVENMISSRLDQSAVKLLSAAEYAAMQAVNVKTLYYADQGDGTVKAYLGNKPIGGDGGGVTVEYAPILSDLTAPDFTITREVMIEYSAKTNVLYGAVPSFIIVDGVYCYFGTINSQNGATVLQQLLQNREFFGNGFSMKCYSKDSAFGTAQVVHHVTEYISERRNASPQTTSTVGYDKFSYSGMDYSHSFSFARANNVQGVIQEYFLVPNIEVVTNVENTTYLTAEQKAILLAAGIEYIPQTVKVLMFYKLGGTWYCTDSYYRGDTLTGASTSNYAVPIWTRDEMDFALGISQRTEPVED